MDMAKDCLRDGTPFGVCAIREGREVGAPATPHEIGTLATIGEWEMPQLGVLHVMAVGGGRFRILERRVEPGGLQRARIEAVADDADAPVPSHCEACVRLLERVIDEHPHLFGDERRLDSSAWVSARLTELLPLALPAKQELLELGNGLERLERINDLIRRPSEN